MYCQFGSYVLITHLEYSPKFNSSPPENRRFSGPKRNGGMFSNHPFSRGELGKNFGPFWTLFLRMVEFGMVKLFCGESFSSQFWNRCLDSKGFHFIVFWLAGFDIYIYITRFRVLYIIRISLRFDLVVLTYWKTVPEVLFAK